MTILICFVFCFFFQPQIYTKDPRTCAILIQAWGSNLGLLYFPIIKITVVCLVRKLPAVLCSECGDKRVKQRTAREDHEHVCLLLFLIVWLAKT